MIERGLTDTEWLLVILGILYLVDGVLWMRRGSAAIVALRTGHHALLTSPLVLENDRGGVALASPLPWAPTYLIPRWPLVLSPKGIVLYSSEALSRSGRPQQPAAWLPFDTMGLIGVERGELRIGGQACLADLPESFAHYLAQNLRLLRDLPEEARAEVIRDRLLERLDVAAVRERARQFNRDGAWLESLATTLTVQGLILGPILYYRLRLEGVGPWPLLVFLSTFLLLWWSVALTYHRLMRRQLPWETVERRKHLMEILITPPAAMRAYQYASRDMLGLWHPLAVAIALVPQPRWRDFGQHLLRDLVYPIQPLGPFPTPEAELAEEWFRQESRLAVEETLRNHGVEPADWLQAPEPMDPDSQSYCPRCLTQFTFAEGTCHECGGLATHHLDPHVKQAENSSV